MRLMEDWTFDQPDFWMNAFGMSREQAQFAASLACVPIPLLPEAIRVPVQQASLNMIGIFTDVPQIIADYVFDNTFGGAA